LGGRTLKRPSKYRTTLSFSSGGVLRGGARVSRRAAQQAEAFPEIADRAESISGEPSFQEGRFIMPKAKTNRSAAKRFRKTGGSKVKRGHATRRHLLTPKSTKRKRQARRSNYIASANMRDLERLLPN
jgi:large subunit ribosomal protein L35